MQPLWGKHAMPKKNLRQRRSHKNLHLAQYKPALLPPLSKPPARETAPADPRLNAARISSSRRTIYFGRPRSRIWFMLRMLSTLLSVDKMPIEAHISLQTLIGHLG